ncbi:DNA/RNA nuclease SfsA [Desulfolutivibrio sp.]|uniref:DNA/RNA nuclease SfsA n=1 Tax=Desulfolutivibrio sp. TaxID=2773296 RepID=UPI003FA4767B
MVFPGGLVRARLVRRRLRFLVDVVGDHGPFTAHTNNTGSMLGLLRPGSPVLLSVSGNPARKLPHTLEMVWMPTFSGGFWVGVNTLTPNRLLAAAFRAGRLPEITGDAADASYDRLEPEPAFAGGRLDARLSGPAGTLLVETKNVTMVEDQAALFPDAATTRGRKHLVELARVALEGRTTGTRAACLFLVQRPDGACFGPAGIIDPEYADLFWQAAGAGVAMWAVRAGCGPEGIDLGGRLPLAPFPECPRRTDAAFPRDRG